MSSTQAHRENAVRTLVSSLQDGERWEQNPATAQEPVLPHDSVITLFPGFRIMATRKPNGRWLWGYVRDDDPSGQLRN